MDWRHNKRLKPTTYFLLLLDPRLPVALPQALHSERLCRPAASTTQRAMVPAGAPGMTRSRRRKNHQTSGKSRPDDGDDELDDFDISPELQLAGGLSPSGAGSRAPPVGRMSGFTGHFSAGGSGVLRQDQVKSFLSRRRSPYCQFCRQPQSSPQRLRLSPGPTQSRHYNHTSSMLMACPPRGLI